MAFLKLILRSGRFEIFVKLMQTYKCNSTEKFAKMHKNSVENHFANRIIRKNSWNWRNLIKSYEIDFTNKSPNSSLENSLLKTILQDFIWGKLVKLTQSSETHLKSISQKNLWNQHKLIKTFESNLTWKLVLLHRIQIQLYDCCGLISRKM